MCQTVTPDPVNKTTMIITPIMNSSPRNTINNKFMAYNITYIVVSSSSIHNSLYTYMKA